MLDFIKKFINDNYIIRFGLDEPTDKLESESKLKLNESYEKFYSHAENVITEATTVIENMQRKIEFMKIKMHVLQQNVSDAVIIETSDCQWSDINTATCNILGIDIQQCIGRNTSDILKVYPNLHTFLTQLVQLESDCIKTRNVIDRTLEIDNDKKLSVRISPVTSPDNSYLELIIIGKLI